MRDISAILSLFSTITFLLVHQTSPSTATTVYFDDLCEEKLYLVVNNVSEVSPCVCFTEGVYEYYPKSGTPCSPIQLTVEETQCVRIPTKTHAVRKLESSFQSSPSSIHSHLTPCTPAHSRVKRDDAAAAPPPADGAAAGGGGGGGGVTTTISDPADEDFSNTGTEIGHELMRNQMNQYIESVIASLTGLQGEGSSGSSSGNKYPAIKLLGYTKQLMQKTCTVVNPDFFDLALHSFVNLQLETYHIKEPYVGYSAFKRIEQAMTRCLAKAAPHVFVTNSTGKPKGAGGDELCDNHVPSESSNQTVLFPGTEDAETRNITIPEYASSIISPPDKIAEPLIETVWKMLVSTHSYCYMYFSDYFNDHHTYTVALLPLFTNKIQEIWLKGGEGYDLSGENKLYGGLLGDVRKILGDVDACVGASREMSPYPWFMNRPMLDKSNVWNRKKRDVNGMDLEQAEEEEETESAKGRLVHGENFIEHICKDRIETC